METPGTITVKFGPIVKTTFCRIFITVTKHRLNHKTKFRNFWLTFVNIPSACGVIIDSTECLSCREKPKAPDLLLKPTWALLRHGFVNKHPREALGTNTQRSHNVIMSTLQKCTENKKLFSASQSVFSLLCHRYTMIQDKQIHWNTEPFFNDWFFWVKFNEKCQLLYICTIKFRCFFWTAD